MPELLPMTKIILRRGHAKPFWFGHPWVYSDAIASVEGEVEPGAVVEVRDHEGRYIGRGLVNPRSQIRVRLLTRRDEPVDAALIARRIAAARDLRRRLGLPGPDTDAYRLVNSEGDGLPGLTVDVYGDALAVQLSAYGMWQRAAVILDALEAALAPRTIFEVSPGGCAAGEGFTVAPRVVRGEARETVTCREHGLTLEVAPLAGQKTGLFLDQRENRRRLGELCSGQTVLDCYTYAGGFGLAALKGGATAVTAVDVSPRALERARRNAELNRLGSLTTIEADVFRYLETARPHSFDVCVVDPPKFARARKDLEPALKGYRRLNALALGVVADGGLLMTCSCSQHVGESDFERMLAGAAQDARRRVQVLELRSMGADHPLPPAFPEGRYLKCMLVRVSDE
jgi:23S rRNA (cytosine1962-C5)-methyltransferase